MERANLFEAVSQKTGATLLIDSSKGSRGFESKGLANAAGQTTILATHRLMNIRRADRILVLHRGAVAEDGSHDQLVARQGAYAALFERQRAAYADP